MSITNLTNTTWYLNDTLAPMGEYQEPAVGDAGYFTTYNINFTSNDIEFKRLACEICESSAWGESEVKYELQYWYLSPEGPDMYEYPYDYEISSWYGYAEPYRTLTITGGDDVTNSELITWLTTNAVQVGGSGPETTNGTTVIYNGNVIATLESGQSATLPCAGKKMDGDIVIEAAEQKVRAKYDGTVVIE